LGARPAGTIRNLAAFGGYKEAVPLRHWWALQFLPPSSDFSPTARDSRSRFSLPTMTFSSLFLIGNLGGSEVIIILVVLLLFFGAKKIPELARGLGKGVREFKDATSEFGKDDDRPATPPAAERRPDSTLPPTV
jgi:sec-independent protein translocase protein TatA